MTQVKVSGPVFDGRATRAVEAYTSNLVKDLGEQGQNYIQVAANEMDKSGRGGTGRAAAGVKLYTSNLESTIFGEMVQGEVWWPWLEGVSKRNYSTRYKGYHTFRNVKARLNRRCVPYAREQLSRYIAEMN